MKKYAFRKIFAIILTAVLMLTFTVSVSAQTPEESDAATKRSVKEVFSSQVDRDTDYNLSRLDLSTLPSYMEESLGFSELSEDKRPRSLTDLYVEDLYSFTTLNEDDTLTLYMFSEPVKYVDKETTAIKFIDNTIKAVETKLPVSSAELSKIGNSLYTAKSYTNTANFFTVDMPASINQGVSLSYEGKRFTLSPASASLSTAELKTATHRGMTEQTVEYRNALGTGVHLQYVPINSGVKENIVLDRYPGKNTFRFIFDAEGYYPIYTEGEAIPFADPSTDEIALILGQVDARDSYTGDETDGHFTLYNSLKLEDLKNGKYVLTVTVDNDFLTDPDTVYPVVIDPSITIPGTGFYDTAVYSAQPTSSGYYSSSYMIVGDHGTSYGEGMAFIQPKSMSNYNYIQSNLINYATYRVREASGKTNSSTIRLYGTTATWNHTTLTYRNKPSFDDGTIDMQTINSSGWYTFDVTRHIRDFINYDTYGQGKPHNCGFALVAANPSASSKHFCSSEHSSSKPSIAINYSPNLYYINDQYRNANGQLQEFKAWGKLINGTAPMFKIKIDTAGTYVFETMDSSGLDGATPTDTLLQIFDYNLNRISINDDDTLYDNEPFSRIQRTLSPGTYYFSVADADDSDGASGTSDSVGKVEGIKCYIVVEGILPGGNGLGELVSANSIFANRLSDFYKVGDNASYNCFDFALDHDGFFSNPDNFTVADAGVYQHKKNDLISQMEGLNRNDIPNYTSNCIIAYSRTNTDFVRHFAISVNGKFYAKLNTEELVMHLDLDAYYESSYGSPYLYFER